MKNGRDIPHSHAPESDNSQTLYERLVKKLFNTSDFTFCFGRREKDRKQQRMAINVHKTLLSTISPVAVIKVILEVQIDSSRVY